MPTLVLILRKIVSFVRLVCMPFKWLFNSVFNKRTSNIGELPFHVISQQTGNALQLDANGIATTSGNASQNVWNNWNENSFTVESKIEEYRRKRAELMQQQQQQQNPNNHSSMQTDNIKTTTTSNADKFDYFNEMQPKIKPPKQLYLQTMESKESSRQQRNMFEMREGEVFVPEQLFSVELAGLPSGRSRILIKDK